MEKYSNAYDKINLHCHHQQNTNNNTSLKPSKSVNFFAISPDLAVRAGERAKVSHLHHSIGKICQKGSGVGAVSVNLTIGRTPTKQLLVRVKKSLLIHQIREVRIVKRSWACFVEGGEVVVAS